MSGLLAMLTPKGFKENLEALTELSSRVSTVEDKEKILALREQMNQLRETALELWERNKELEEKLKLKEQVVFLNGKYWLLNEDGSKDGPCYPTCKDRDQKLIRFRNDVKQWTCLACKCGFRKTDDEMTDEDRETLKRLEAEAKQGKIMRPSLRRF